MVVWQFYRELAPKQIILSSKFAIPYLRFNCVGYCKTCNSTNPTLTKYSAFLNYQVITNGTQMIYGAYSYKTIGINNITVSISTSGAVTFGGTLVSHTDYQARGVTLIP